MNINLNLVERRVMRYWYVDGFGELIGGGGMCLTLSLYFTLQQYFGDDSLISIVLQAGLFLVLFGGFSFFRRMINIMKNRVTYPRTGYVEYRTVYRGNKTLMGGVVLVISMALASLFMFIVRNVRAVDGMVLVSGVVMAFILFLKPVWTTKVRRFYVLCVFALTVGLALSVSGLQRGYNLGLFYGLMGIAFALSGGLTLSAYLRENPMLEETGNGE